MQPFCFALSATFTAEPIESALTFWGKQFGLPLEVRFAPYNQVMQSLLDPRSVLAKNSYGLCVVLVRPADLGETPEQAERNVLELARTAATARLGVPLLFVLCPPAGDALAARVKEALAGTRFLSAQQVEAQYPVAQWDNPQGHQLGRIPYTDLYFAALGTAIFRHAHSIFAPPAKVIALDCDNTLWSGICGEDGPSGVVVDEPRRELQTFMRSQRDAGMLLVLASKNNEADVRETFAQQEGMPLAWDDFVSTRINWQPKSANLADLASELELGVDSFVLVDDNPLECAEVAEDLPGVITVPLPEEPSKIGALLRQLWVFDHPVITDEDRKRSAMYAQNRAYTQALQQTASLENFLESLGLVLEILPLDEASLARAAQLTQRTNQFNFTTVRRTEAEMRAYAGEAYTVAVRDRFGKYGITGLVMLEDRGSYVELDTFLLSCRVLGRGVEYRLFRWLGEKALERGRAEIEVRFTPTAKNTPARQFLEAIGGYSESGRARLKAAELVGLKPKFAPIPHSAPKAAAPAERVRADYVRLAQELGTAEQILAAIRGPAALETTTEGQLAALWSELLQRPVRSGHDNFFDLGGHSLLAVLLLVRIKETFGVELTIDDVYSSGMTLRKLAGLIEAKQTAGLDSAEYSALLAEIENLSEEEVRELLAREERPGDTL